MKIFSVVGVSNSGKNGIIKHCMKTLISMKETEVVYFSSNRNKDSSKTGIISFIDKSIEEGLVTDRNIKILVISIANKIIGLTTYGDSFKDIELALIKAQEKAVNKTGNELDYFVCARHKKNNIRNEFHGKCKKLDEIMTIKSVKLKSESKDKWNEENKKHAEELLEKMGY